MRLSSGDGSSIDLTPLAYEFPHREPDGDQDWDANWLVVRGTAALADGRAWTFTEPCLTTWEARELHAFLADAAGGRLDPAGQGADDWQLAFVENLLAFDLVSVDASRAAIRVELAAEARPPWLEDVHDSLVITLTMARAVMAAAAAEWVAEIAEFPVR